MKKVMISYSKDDLKLIHRFMDALVPLHDEGLIENPWYCTLLEAGSDWNGEIQKNLKEADIVFFMCSMSFIRTPYIREHEIKTAKSLKTLNPGKLLIPIVLNFCHWEDYLGEFSALPYTVKPVVDFKNEDMAWYMAVTIIRKLLREEFNDDKKGLDTQIRKLFERVVKGEA